jgi:hypothetical protein
MGNPHGHAPAVTTNAPAAITPNAATLQGTVSADGSTTDYHFKYGTTTTYASATPSASVAAGSTKLPVSQQISGLTPMTIYHFQLVATNAAGTTASPDATFVTPPTVTPGAFSGIKE